MDKYIKTVIGDITTINLDQPRQVQQWTEILGVTETELRHSVAIVGVSAREVWRHLRRHSPGIREPGHGIPSTCFAQDGNAMRASSLLAQLRETLYERKEILDEFTRLVPRLLDAIHEGRLLLDYAPPPNDAVWIPHHDHPHYLQALLYWAIRLDTTLPILTEAHARLDGSPTIGQMSAMFKKIDDENRAMEADYTPPVAVSYTACIQDGIYKALFTTDGRSLGDGVCIARDDEIVGGNFGYAVSGKASLDDEHLVLSTHFTRHPGHHSPLHLPPTFALTLRGLRRPDGFELTGTLPTTDVEVLVSGRRISD